MYLTSVGGLTRSVPQTSFRGYLKSTFAGPYFDTAFVMAFEATTMLELILLLTWACLHGTHKSLKHPMFKAIIPTEAVLKQIAAGITLYFAAGLFDALQSPHPPSLTFFKSLPTDTFRKWAIYVLVLEAPGRKFRIYIGSGTAALFGVSSRFAEYNKVSNMPRRVQEALADGYKITHKGLLCWIPIPTAALLPKTRLMFVAMEAAFAFVFWAMDAVEGDYNGASLMCPWERADLPYTGLCTHCSLFEAVVGDFGLSAEELEAQSAEMKERRAAAQSVISSNFHFRQLETNAEYYHDRKNRKQKQYAENHPEKSSKSIKNARIGPRPAKSTFAKSATMPLGSPGN